MNQTHDEVVRLAQEVIMSYVSQGKVQTSVTLPHDLPQQAACFVSLHEIDSHQLRGCMGTLEPHQESLFDEIVQNAISASTRDPRFPPVGTQELDNLSVNVDILSASEPTDREQLNARVYGVIVSQGFKRGVLLPDLEGVDSVEEQLSIACMKAGIDPLSEYAIERFTVERHE